MLLTVLSVGVWLSCLSPGVVVCSQREVCSQQDQSVLYSGPIADGVAVLCCFALLHGLAAALLQLLCLRSLSGCWRSAASGNSRKGGATRTAT